MKNELKTIAIVFACFVAALWIAKPLRELLINYNMPELDARLIAGILPRLLIVIGAIRMINKLGLKAYNGFTKGQKIKNMNAIVIPSTFIILGVIANWNTYTEAGSYLLLLFTFSVIIVGMAEELVFRGIIQPLFIRHFNKRKKSLYLSAVITALIFGLIHYINLLKEPDNFWGITSQVVFAFSIGVFFGGLTLRTGSILVPSIFHGLVNFAFGTGDLKQQPLQAATKEISEGINWSSIIPTTLFFAFILLGGIYMIRKVSTEEVSIKLGIEMGATET